MSIRDTSAEQARYRLRMITSAVNERRCAPADEVNDLAGYLDDVADELERNGVAVDAMEIDARRPLKGRLVIARTVTRRLIGSSASLTLTWQRDFGWSLAMRGRLGEPSTGWRHLYGDPGAAPDVVADFLRRRLPVTGDSDAIVTPHEAAAP